MPGDIYYRVRHAAPYEKGRRRKKARGFMNDTAQGVAFSGAQSKGARTNGGKSGLVYDVGKMDVENISLGEMARGTGRAPCQAFSCFSSGGIAREAFCVAPCPHRKKT